MNIAWSRLVDRSGSTIEFVRACRASSIEARESCGRRGRSGGDGHP